MLQSARFRNFKALRDVSLDLERLTVLVGANGCGKTSVLEAIDLVCRRRYIQPAPLGSGLIRGSQRFKTSGADWPISLELHGTEHFTLSINQPASKRAAMKVTPEQFTGTAKSLPRAARLRLNAENLASPSFTDPGRLPTLGPSGKGLASVLAYLAGRRSGAIDRIEADMRRIVPRIDTIRVEPELVTRTEIEYVQINNEAIPRHEERSYSGHRLEVGFRDAGFLRAEMISEGTLLALGMLTVLHADDAPSLILFDDIDRGLHPSAQRAVFTCLRQLLDTRPELQIVCTTHSPYALDCVRPEEVRVLKLDAAGHTHVRKLTDHPEWPQWKDHLAPGEFWSAYGEDWVYGEADAG